MFTAKVKVKSLVSSQDKIFSIDHNINVNEVRVVYMHISYNKIALKNQVINNTISASLPSDEYDGFLINKVYNKNGLLKKVIELAPYVNKSMQTEVYSFYNHPETHLRFSLSKVKSCGRNQNPYNVIYLKGVTMIHTADALIYLLVLVLK